MSNTELTLNQSFFDQLWPLILDENICDTKSKNTSPYFEPQQPFDHLWAHEFLAKRNYGQYEPPIDFLSSKCAPTEVDATDDAATTVKRTPITLDDGVADECEFEKNRGQIKTLDQQIAEVNAKREWRENLAYEFRNRTYPWYMPKPDYDFETTNELMSLFVQPFERELLRAIQIFNCRFLIINLGADTCWLQIENWLKFCKFLKVLIIVRKEELVQKLSTLNESSIKAFLFEDNFENTWQQELTRALDEAVIYALAKKFLENCSDGFIFVFSSRVDSNCLDRFKVLRRS